MHIIDLSQPLYDDMPVYPGDPEVHVEQIHHLDKEGWRLRYLQMSTHAGTHVDAFAHMDKKGETIDNLPIGHFIGETTVVTPEQDFPRGLGLAFREGKLELTLLDKIVAAQPRFVAVGGGVEWPVELERKLLQSGITTITDLVNMDKLPSDKHFTLYAVPLKIKDGDGSPVRAFAVIE